MTEKTNDTIKLKDSERQPCEVWNSKNANTSWNRSAAAALRSNRIAKIPFIAHFR